MSLLRMTGALALLLGARAVYADSCSVTIEGNDRMQFNLHQITVPSECSEVEVRLRHSGKMSARVMGHDWVLAKDSDMFARLRRLGRWPRHHSCSHSCPGYSVAR